MPPPTPSHATDDSNGHIDPPPPSSSSSHATISTESNPDRLHAFFLTSLLAHRRERVTRTESDAIGGGGGDPGPENTAATTLPAGGNKWDEMCFVMLKQTPNRRRQNLEPRTQLLCYMKIPNTRGPPTLQIIKSDDYAATASHLDGMMSEMVLYEHHPPQPQPPPQSGIVHSNVNVNDNANVSEEWADILKNTTSYKLPTTNSTNPQPNPTSTTTTPTASTRDYLAKLYKPHLAFAQKYADGWTDGSHVSLVRTYVSSVARGEPYRLAKQYAGKWREWYNQVK
ncbi:hypothetical protein DFJ77DRAFT_477104 [Powellomyces hirtus]|nr:hypothetical protein DFJ77DRAFT_477104 [Powellomyces hirtus]